jgi:hypothetical protein
MASYTDTVPKFNPYVQTIPVDEMVKVGMYKQEKYDEGIQKIQTNIDNIAGLDVVRDVDKAYLQSKLNQLGNNLTTVAAGDFSNFQLVNSVNGMTNQISKDPNVLNAISSARTYRKGLEDMDAANKAGKGAASHDWLFRTEANDWLSSSDINKSFNGGYKQYSPYQKNAEEVIKGLVKNENITDVSLEFDANGNVVGVLDATTRTKIAGITPERIQEALLVGLSPNDWQSMQIDGRYNYSNTTPEQFVSDTNKSYESDYNSYRDMKDKLSSAMDSTKSAITKQQLRGQIEALDRKLENISAEYGRVSKTFASGDVESAKATLYSTKWVNNFSKAFAHQDVSKTDETNPYQQVKQYRETAARQASQWLSDYNQRNAFHAEDRYFKLRDDQRAENKDKREQKEADALGGYGGLGFSLNQDDLPEINMQKVQDQIHADEESIKTSDNEFVKTSGKSQTWLNQQYSKWQQNPGSVDALIADHFKGTEEKRRDIVANNFMIAQISSEADEKFGKIEDLVPKGVKPFTVEFQNSSMTFNPEDFVKFNQIKNNYQVFHTSPSGAGMYGGGGATTYDYEKAKKELSRKDYLLFESYTRPKNPTETLLKNQINYYETNVNAPFQKTLINKDAYVQEQIMKRTVAMQGVEYGIPLNNETQKASFGNFLQQVADLASSQEDGLANSPGLNIGELRKIAPKIQNANIRIVEGTQFAPGMYQITAADDEGSTQTFRLTPEQYKLVFGEKFEPEPSVKQFRNLETQMKRMGGDTTSLDGLPTNIGNSFMGNALNFVNVNHYTVSGNVVKSKNSGLYQVRVNVTDPKTGKVIVEDLGHPSGGLIEENMVIPAIQGLTDERVFEMLYNRKPTNEELKQLQQ